MIYSQISKWTNRPRTVTGAMDSHWGQGQSLGPWTVIGGHGQSLGAKDSHWDQGQSLGPWTVIGAMDSHWGHGIRKTML